MPTASMGLVASLGGGSPTAWHPSRSMVYENRALSALAPTAPTQSAAWHAHSAASGVWPTRPPTAYQTFCQLRFTFHNVAASLSARDETIAGAGKGCLRAANRLARGGAAAGPASPRAGSMV